MTDSFSFPLSEKVFISPSCLKDSFTRYRVCNWQFFLFRAWKMCFFFSEWEIHYHSDWHSCIDNVSFFDFFKKSLSLNFKTFMMYLDLNFFGFILIGVFSLSLKSLSKFEKFLAIISLNIFSAPYSCSLSLGFWWCQESQGSVNFFFQSIFYCSNWLNSIDLSSIHRFCLLHIITGPTQ